MGRREAGRERARFGIDDVVDVTLPIERDVLGPMPRDRHIAHQLEQRVQFFRLGMGVLDELKAVGAGRIVGADFRGRRVVRKWTHRWSPLEFDPCIFRPKRRNVHANGRHFRYVAGRLEPLSREPFDLPDSSCRFDLSEIEKLLD